MFKVNDFFCGAGGMGLGFLQAGFTIVGAWDNDKYAVQSYKENIGEHVLQKDIKEMIGEDVPYADVWTFGFPCQDLSVAGKMKGLFAGERSGLFFEVMRLLSEVAEKPKIILAENVKGLKPYLDVLRDEYKNVGYTMDYTLYNSKYWGVPQNRERYFVIGIRDDLNLPFTFPEQQTTHIPKLSSILEEEVDEKYYLSDEKAKKIIEQAIEGLKVKQATKKGYDIAKPGDSINISHPNSKTRRGRVGKQVAQTLLTGQEQVVVLQDIRPCITPDRIDKRQNGRRAKENEAEMFTLTAQDLHGIIEGKNKEIELQDAWTDKDGCSYTCNSTYYKGLLPSYIKKKKRTVVIEPKVDVVGMLDIKGQENIRRVYNPDGLSPTLTASEGGHRQPKIMTVSYNRKEGIEKEIDVAGAINSSDWRGLNQNQSKAAVVEGYRVRKLTPREYARLQGFPDSYKFVCSDTQMYRQFGNAVSVPVAKAIAEAIKESLS